MTEQAETELGVFRRFASLCPHDIQMDSIEKRQPPEPDIYCTLCGGEGLTFELVEVVDQSMARRHSDKLKLEMILRRAYEKSPVKGLDDATIVIFFDEHASITQRKSSIADLLDLLSSLPSRFAGRVPLQGIAAAGVVRKVVVSRECMDGPYFGINDVGSFGDPALSRILRKLSKSYAASAPLELLAYYNLQQPDFGTGWEPNLCGLPAALAESQFRRVWVFNVPDKRIEWVNPTCER